MMIRYLLSLTLTLLTFAAFAQSNAALKGTVKDETGEPLIGAGLTVFKNGVSTGKGATTDFDGNYYIGGLDAGTYDVEVKYLGYATLRQTGIKVLAGQVYNFDPQLVDESNALGEVVIRAEKPSVVKLGNPTGGQTLTSEDIKSKGTRNLTTLAGTSAKVSQTDEGKDLNSGGSRGDGNITFVDGVRVRGNTGLNEKEVEQLQVITGGVPAQFGDATGAIINIITKTPPAKFGGSVQVETSQFLDAYGTNRLDLGFNGPIILKNSVDDNGKVILGTDKKPLRESVLGFRLSGTFYTSQDALPSSLGSYKLKDGKLAEIEANPIVLYNGALTPAAQLVTENDIVKTKVRPNNRDMNFQGNGTLHYRMNKDMSLRVSGQYYNERAKDARNDYRLFNADRNPVQQNYDWRIRGEFRHNIPSGDSSFIQNANYSLQLDYTRNYRFVQDTKHKENLFNYGYIGKFVEQLNPFFTNNDAGELVHTNFNRTLVSYTPNYDINPILANYNNYVDDFFGTNLDLSSYRNINGTFQASGGTDVFDELHSNAGVVYNLYNKTQSNQLGVRAQANFDLVKPGSQNRHSIQVGLIFEQLNDRQYSLNPSRLWFLARSLANSHLNESAADLTNPIGTQQVYNSVLGGYQDVTINAPLSSGSSESEFSKNLRSSLGINQTDWVNVFALNPDQLNIKMFSPTDLMTNNGVLEYYGYDYLGNPTGKANFDDFFTKRNESGVYTRPIAPFAPVYAAAYIEDRFQYKDIIFRVGLRADRYDANTKVLRDPYSIYGAYTAGDIANSRYNNIKNNIPSTIGPNAMVYVSSAENPESATVTAYRDGDRFYNSAGIEVNNPNVLGDVLLPARKDYSEANSINIDNAAVPYDPSLAFRDFNPITLLMPRLAFSFPISEDAEFFAHYDVLSQKPTSAVSLATPQDYFNFTEKATSSSSAYSLFANPDLRPTRTTDYEAGYQQKISENAGLKFSIYYREFRDMVQVRRWQLAYPRSYESYANDDFATSKGFTVEYDLQRVNNIRLVANYTLQFADGTGSGTASNRGLTDVTGIFRDVFPLDYDQRHQMYVSLDYRYGEGKEYDGPEWFGKKIFENTGANLEFNVNSGTPYTRKAIATKFGGNNTEGTRNGARLPWNYRLDFRLDKDFCLTPKRIDSKTGKKALYMNVYIRIQNLLNTQNILGVYPATSSPVDDGFLTDPNGNGPRFLQQQADAGFSNYEVLYNLRMRNPDNYSLPRRIYIGASFDF